MEKFKIANAFGMPEELIGERLVIPGFEDVQFVLHAWLYDKHGGWAVTELSTGKRILSGREGTEREARARLEQQLKAHGKEALMRVLGRSPSVEK